MTAKRPMDSSPGWERTAGERDEMEAKPSSESARPPTPGPRLPAYDLRHSCATLLLAQGEHPKIVSERLGHASVTLTLDTYSHVLPTMQEKATEKLEETLFAKRKKSPKQSGTAPA